MTDIVTHLRAWGLKVETSPGYKDRGRPYAFHPKAIFVHHTASNSLSGNFGSARIVTSGRAGLPGPLSQFLLGRDGTVRVVALGYANHAGTGGPRAGVPRNMGNTYAWGIEAENNGIGERWGHAQLNAYYQLCAALLDWMGTKDVRKVFGHKEWTSRKIDPAGINMDQFRTRVKEALERGPVATRISLSKLQFGKTNRDVLLLKQKLHRRGFFDEVVDPKTNKSNLDSSHFGKGLREAYAEYQRSLGYKGADADGIPGPTSLRKLGFWVQP